MDSRIAYAFSALPLLLMISLMQSVFVLVISALVLLLGKVLKKDSFKKNLLGLLPFYKTFFGVWVAMSFMWDIFVEGRDKIFHYWDQLPLGGFMLWRHDQPATISLSKDLAPGVSLLTIDLIWLGMLVSTYTITLVLYKLLFYKNSKVKFIYPFVISITLLIVGLLLGFNKRGMVI